MDSEYFLEESDHSKPVQESKVDAAYPNPINECSAAILGYRLQELQM